MKNKILLICLLTIILFKLRCDGKEISGHLRTTKCGSEINIKKLKKNTWDHLSSDKSVAISKNIPESRLSIFSVLNAPVNAVQTVGGILPFHDKPKPSYTLDASATTISPTTIISPNVPDIPFHCKGNSCGMCHTVNMIFMEKKGCAELILDSADNLSGFYVKMDGLDYFSLPFGKKAYDLLKICFPFPPFLLTCISLYNVQLVDYNIKFCINVSTPLFFVSPSLNLFCLQIGTNLRLIFPAEFNNANRFLFF